MFNCEQGAAAEVHLHSARVSSGALFQPVRFLHCSYRQTLEKKRKEEIKKNFLDRQLNKDTA